MPLKIVLINPRHSYGGKLVYLPGSIVAIGAVLIAMGHKVHFIDLNLDRIKDAATREALRWADFVGISLTGAPYIPETLRLIPTIRQYAPSTPILLGGQVIACLAPEQFARIYAAHAGVMQIRDNTDLAQSLGCNITSIPSAYAVPFTPVYQAMGEERLVQYLRHEMTLVVSQGCHFKCAFCAAPKQRPEEFHALMLAEVDLRYLAQVAKRHDLNELRFYASSLDFFQNPNQVQEVLAMWARVQEEVGVRFRVRVLSCLSSFLMAYDKTQNFGKLFKRAGLWCVGFGSDGTSEEIWEEQKKPQNTLTKLVGCIELSHELGLRAELLMVLGFPEESWKSLGKTVATSLWAIAMWPDALIRPYLAKPFVPGNDGWAKDAEAAGRVVADPTLFYNLDFAALASEETHPRHIHRHLSNFAYLALCSLTLVGKGSTSPLSPQGGRGKWLARIVNRLMPFDR